MRITHACILRVERRINMACTNSGLAAYCREALKLKTVYMWGGLFREVTKGYIQQLSGIKGYKPQYPAERVAYLSSLTDKGYYGCDCVGLVKSYYFGGVGTAKNAKGYSGSLDYGVGTMYKAATVKGKIADMPKKEGVLVMSSDFGHVGVYIGGNEVVECTLSRFGDGVVKTKFSDRAWAWWCQCPCIGDDTGVSEIRGGADKKGGCMTFTNANVNIRETAGLNGRIIGKLLPKTEIELTGETEMNSGICWAGVIYNGKRGWCDRQWVDC